MLGCGPRARGHADAYKHVKKSKLVAVCDMNEERLGKFTEEWGIEKGYKDIHEMLDKEKPDLLHIVTQPNLRVPLLTLASEAEVPAVLVEKPLCVDSADFRAIADLHKTTKTKIAVNHQLRFHPKVLELLDDVMEGRIGDVRFIDGTSRLNLAGQGTHILNLVFAFNGGVRPVRVFGQVSGDSQLNTHHPAPDMAVGELVFANEVHGVIANGLNAPMTSDDEKAHMHKRIAVFGTRGFVHWKMQSWERSTTKVDYESGEKDYRAEDVLGQAAMTDAMFDWLEDDKKTHPNCLDVSLAESNTVLGMYASAIQRKPIELPFEPQESLLDELRKIL